ncbi:MAG TPA: hypothetical protein GXZ43_04820 [Clostridiaceae bacterium]|nr:hypothetical protein [Clostridiaceae bacterium]
MKRRFLSYFIVIIILLSLVACDSLNIFGGDSDKNKTDNQAQNDASNDDADIESNIGSAAEISGSKVQVDRIIELIQADDPELLMEWVHPNAIEKYGRDQIVERNNKVHSGIGLESIELSDFSALGDTEKEGTVSYQGNAVYKTVYGDIEKQVTYNFIFHPNANRWQLDWTPSVILPGLHAQGLVQVQPIRATRGNIYDREGNPLAIKGYINRIGIVPDTLKESNIPIIEELYGLSEGFIQSQLELEWVKDNTFVPLKTMTVLSEEQKTGAADLGVIIEPVETRSYPLGEAAAHLIGYVGCVTAEDLEKEEYAGMTGQDYIGKTGIEAIYDKELRGEHGFRVVVTGDYEQILLEKEVVHGQDLYLTIDSTLQQTIYEAAKDKDACFSALDPRNGDILALVSTPSYDPHDFVLGISYEKYQELLDNPLNPLYGKFNQAMIPGSAEKIVTAIAGLNAGTLTLDTTYDIQGKGWTYDESWGLYQVIRYQTINGIMDLDNAIVTSDNIYFARVALDMGFAAFNEQMSNLLFGEPIAKDYPFGISQTTNEGSVDNTILLADAGYGQGELLVNPIHLSSIYGAVANDGIWYRPRILLTTEPELITQNITNHNNILYLDNSLRSVVTETYPNLNLSNVKIAGKTGTAEVGEDYELGRMKENSWLVSYDQNQRNMVLCTIDFNSHYYGVGFGTLTTKLMYETIYADGPYSPPESVDPNQTSTID